MDAIRELATDGRNVLVIRLGNQDFELERKRVPVSFLKLDPGNQRLSNQIQRSLIHATDQELHRMLWDIDQVKDLYQSVLQNGGLIEDPIVRRDGIVVEGNCRTVVLRELHKKFPKDARFQHLYVRTLPDSFTEEQLMMLLGELHIAGKIEWRAFDQAEYVWKMNKLFSKSYDYLASHLRWSRSKLSQKIAAYEETKKYMEETGDPQAINRFSHFEEFMKRKELRDRREQDSAFMREFRGWVHAGKFPDAKDVRDLPDILENAEAIGKFEKSDMRGAKQVLFRENPSLISNLYSVLDQATHELTHISLVELEDLKNGGTVKVEKLRALRVALDRVVQHAGIRV